MGYERLLEAQGYVLAAAQSYRDLCQTGMREDCEVAVLHPTLSHGELSEVGHFVRRRWPAAKIVIIRAEEWWLEDVLYDDRVVPGAIPELLLATVVRFAT
jgi:hypothetical protein